MKNLCILGATGSIGTQTLDVIREQKEDFTLHSISSNKNAARTMEIIDEFMPAYVTVMDETAFRDVKAYCSS